MRNKCASGGRWGGKTHWQTKSPNASRQTTRYREKQQPSTSIEVINNGIQTSQAKTERERSQNAANSRRASKLLNVAKSRNICIAPVPSRSEWNDSKTVKVFYDMRKSIAMANQGMRV